MKEDLIQHPLKKDDILYFLHIPKTAGTSFTAILDNFFDLYSICPEQTWHQFLRKMPNFNYNFIRGHYGYSICKILPKEPVCITMLRDPIDRTRSYYDHIHAYPKANHQLPDDYLSDDESLLDVLNNKDKKKIFSNVQTRHIAVDIDGLSLSKLLGSTEHEKYVGIFENFPAFVDIDTSDSTLITKAKKRLSKFAFVGLVEKYEESLLLLYYTFGWKPIRNKWKLMQTGKTKKEDLSELTMKAIKNCTKLDQELYGFARQLFEQRYTEMINILKEKYYEPRLSNLSFLDMMFELLEKNYESNLILQSNYQSSINYNFSKALSGSGWHYREFSQLGTVYRWTGDDVESTIDFQLSNVHDVTIRFRIIDKIESDVVESLQVFSNGIPIDIKKIQQNGNTIIFEAFISKKILQSKKKVTNLTFKVNRTVQVVLNNPPIYTGTRMVGLAFDQILVHPTLDSQLENIDLVVRRFIKELKSSA